MPREDNLRYRGWTMVDRGRFRFASKDGTKVLRRVCRESATKAEAIRAFRAVVDREEGEQ